MEQDSLPEEVIEAAVNPTLDKPVRRRSLPVEEQNAFVIQKVNRQNERAKRQWNEIEAQKQRDKRARLRQAVIEKSGRQ